LLVITCSAQVIGGYEPKPWSIMEYSGVIGLNGMYGINTIENDTDKLQEIERSSFAGNVNFTSKSYIWHPNFMVLDLSASYNPSVRKQIDLVSPDYSSSLDRKKLNLYAEFLRHKRLTFGTSLNLSESYSNMENITSSRHINKSYGAGINFYNKVAPLNLSYEYRTSFVKESNTDRIQDQIGYFLRFSTSNSFNGNYKSKLRVTYKEDNNSLGTQRQFKSNIFKTLFTNNIWLSKKNKQNTLTSQITIFNHEFNSRKSNRLDFSERLGLYLTKRLNWTTNAFYTIRSFEDSKFKSLTTNTSLSYMLYSSLFSRARVSYRNATNNAFKQTEANYLFSTKYTKKIPLDGSLRLHYDYRKRINNTDGGSNLIEIFNQDIVLSDDELVLLPHSNINLNSIIVRNSESNLIYEENIDYILIETGSFIEIQRVPGGLIENNSTVLITYNAQPNKYNINSNNSNLGASLNLFDGIVNFNYAYSTQNFSSSSNISYGAENYFSRNSYGAQINYKFFKGNLQYENYDSALVPYKSLNYNINLQGNYRQKLLYSLDYRVNDYSVIQEKTRTEKREYLTGMVSYRLNYETKMVFRLGYNKRTVNDDGRDWITGRVSFTKLVGALSFNANVNFFNSETTIYRSNYIGGNITIIRKF
jgi:hypothetical protein